MMANEEVVALYAQARQHYGDEHQMKKCAEECCELSTAILRLTTGCDGHSQDECLDNVMEELVDVDIMLAQMGGIFEQTKNSRGLTLLDIYERKLQRLKARVEEEALAAKA